MKRISKALFLCGCILLLVPALASAIDISPPEPFYVISEDGSRIFHVTPEWHGWEEWDKGDFPAMGLYYNTEPPIPIYLFEVPLLASIFHDLWENNFIFSKDLQYFVWIPTKNWVSDDMAENIALVFYANGDMQKTYMISDLVHDTEAVGWVSGTVAAWRHERSGGITFDAESNQLTVKTVDEQTYVFDITRGEIIEVNGEAVRAIHSQAQFFTSQSVALIAAGVILLIGALIFINASKWRGN